MAQNDLYDLTHNSIPIDGTSSGFSPILNQFSPGMLPIQAPPNPSYQLNYIPGNEAQDLAQPQLSQNPQNPRIPPEHQAFVGKIGEILGDFFAGGAGELTPTQARKLGRPELSGQPLEIAAQLLRQPSPQKKQQDIDLGQSKIDKNKAITERIKRLNAVSDFAQKMKSDSSKDQINAANGIIKSINDADAIMNPYLGKLKLNAQETLRRLSGTKSPDKEKTVSVNVGGRVFKTPLSNAKKRGYQIIGQ